VEDWFGDDKTYINHLGNCARSPTDIFDTDGLEISCLAAYGGPINPNVAIGSFDDKNYFNGTHAVITIPVLNDKVTAAKALVWEKVFLGFVQDFIENRSKLNVTGLNEDGTKNHGDWVELKLKIAYTAERSVEDEIERESGTDVTTVLFSYVVMFCYVSFALGQFSSFSRIFIDSKLTVGFVGVAIVMASIVCSLGLFSYLGVKMTLIIIEVLPFLVLAVGVDNIFIMVQHLQRDKPLSDKETVEDQVSRVLAEVGPSMFLSSGCETVAFFIGALSTMPAVRSFSMFAGAAILFDFLLQITCFVSVLTLDEKRRKENKYDILCCCKSNNVSDPETEDGLLYYLTKKYFTKLLLNSISRPLIIVIFAGGAAFSLASMYKIDIGLDQKLSMPEDSYLIDYFQTMSESLEVGAPVYFVVKDGLDYSNKSDQNLLCGAGGCNPNSLTSSIQISSSMPDYSTIAQPAMSWIDDYYDWVSPKSKCCRVYKSDGSFCPTNVKDRTSICEPCITTDRPDGVDFGTYLADFLNDPPTMDCPKGGSAAYSSSVNITAGN
jgi:Niemann-Pick C1 protein